MAQEEKRVIIHFDTLEGFQARLTDGTLTEKGDYIVLIKDSALIWVKGQFFTGPSVLSIPKYIKDCEIIRENGKPLTLKFVGAEWNTEEKIYKEFNKTIELTLASTQSDGLMSKEDKAKVDKILTTGAVILESDRGFIVEKGLRSAQYLKVGYTEDVTSMTLLICKRKSPSHWHGMMGRLFLFRGHEDAFNISQMRDIVITECLRGNVVYDLQPNIGSSVGVELGTATYKEEDYLAIRFEGTSMFSIYFTGVYSGDCTFELVHSSDVTFATNGQNYEI